MVRNPGSIPANPVDIINQYARVYYQGKTKKYVQVTFFSKLKMYCDKLLVFGGAVYQHKKGYVWMCSDRKELIALYKLLSPLETVNKHIQQFKERMEKEIDGPD